jgi:hypothetical protein
MEFLVPTDWQMGEPSCDPAVYTPAFKGTIQSGHFVKVEIDYVTFFGRIIATYYSISNIGVNERPIVESMQPMEGYLKRICN